MRTQRILCSIRSRLNDGRGFTLAEMMVGLTLGAIGSAVLFSIFIGTQRTYTDTQNTVTGGGDTRAVLGMMDQEIRSSGSDGCPPPPDGVGPIGLLPLVSASADTLHLQSDLNSNGVLETANEPSEDVTYFYDAPSQTLQRNPGTGSVVLLSDVLNCNFVFLDAQGNQIGNGGNLSQNQLASVRSVRVQLTLKSPHKDGSPIQLESTATLRNAAG